MSDSRDKRLAAVGATATLAAVVALLYPELAIPAASAGAVATSAVEQFFASRAARREDVAQDLQTASLAASGLPMDDLLARIAEDPRILGAFENVVRIASVADSRAKVRALGRCIGTMATDEALIDPELIWIDIERQIDRPHLKVLLLVRDKQLRYADSEYLDENGNYSLYSRRAAIYEKSGLGPLTEPLIVLLTNLGLLTPSDPANTHNSEFMLTDAGLQLLDRLEVAASEGPEW